MAIPRIHPFRTLRSLLLSEKLQRFATAEAEEEASGDDNIRCVRAQSAEGAFQALSRLPADLFAGVRDDAHPQARQVLP